MTVPAQVLAAVRSIPHPRQETPMTAPHPSPAEQAVIDRFGIFEPEKDVERVEKALEEWLYAHSDDSNPDLLASALIGESPLAPFLAEMRPTAAEVARMSPDGTLVAIRRGDNDWRVSNGGHYRDQHVADWLPLALAPVPHDADGGERR